MSDEVRAEVRGCVKAQPLTAMPAGASCRVRQVASEPPELLVKLSSLGLVPGVVVVLQQRLPAAVLRIGETTIALDTEIAERILVERL